MKRLLISSLLTLLVCAAAFAQSKAEIINTDEAIYPSRENNYCLSDSAVATASSTASTNGDFSPASTIDGDRIGQFCPFTTGSPCWGNNGGWNDATRDVFPDWLRVDFGRAHSIGRIVVTTYQDRSGSPRIEPYLGLQVGQYGIEDYYVQVLKPNGEYVTVGSITGNEDTIREFTFFPVTGIGIRLVVTDAYVHYSRVIELEAYSVLPPA
jgi:hypothetical protein